MPLVCECGGRRLAARVCGGVVSGCADAMGVLARSRGCPALAGFDAGCHTGPRSAWTSARKAPHALLAPAAANGQAPCRRRRVGCVIPPDNASVGAAVAGPQFARSSGGCHCETAKSCIGILWWGDIGSVFGAAPSAGARMPLRRLRRTAGSGSTPSRLILRRDVARCEAVSGRTPRIRVDSAEVHVAGGVRGTLRSCFGKSRGGARVASIRWTPNRPVGALRLMPSRVGMCVAQPRRGRQPFTQRPDGRQDLAPTRARRLIRGGAAGVVGAVSQTCRSGFARRFAPPPQVSTPYRDFWGNRDLS